MKKIIRFAIYLFAIIGFVLVLGFFATKFGWTNTSGIVDNQRNSFLKKDADYVWNKGDEWQTLKTAILKDRADIDKASTLSGVPSRLIVGQLVVEQLRLFHTNRELFKSVFAPLKILGNQSQFSWGVMGLKQDTAREIENNLRATASPFYLGTAYERLLDFKTSDIDTERFTRITDENSRFYSYLYTGLYLKQIETQWKNAGFDISDKPEILGTLYNIGFVHSKPKANPEIGGAEITIGDETLSFGRLVGEFYYSNELVGEFLRQNIITENPKTARILFGGDIMLDRSIRKKAEAKKDLYENGGYDFIFSCFGDFFAGYDAVIANLEGPVTNNKSSSISTKIGDLKNTQFTFDPLALGALKKIGVRAVSLGNNHIYDFGAQGIYETESHLKNIGISSFGNPLGKNVSVIFVDSLPITLVSYNEFFGSASSTIKDIEQNKTNGLVVVFAHWGDEYTPRTERVKSLARQFVDAGAGLVVGAHPHIAQESEIYKEVPIYYSLGNFIFDQYFDEFVQKGLLLDVELVSKNGFFSVSTVKEIKIKLGRDGRTCVE
jgi:poly-gamma-glutamate synthesis protein (capsule biosynthesis protein)